MKEVCTDDLPEDFNFRSLFQKPMNPFDAYAQTLIVVVKRLMESRWKPPDGYIYDGNLFCRTIGSDGDDTYPLELIRVLPFSEGFYKCVAIDELHDIYAKTIEKQLYPKSYVRFCSFSCGNNHRNVHKYGEYWVRLNTPELRNGLDLCASRKISSEELLRRIKDFIDWIPGYIRALRSSWLLYPSEGSFLRRFRIPQNFQAKRYSTENFITRAHVVSTFSDRGFVLVRKSKNNQDTRFIVESIGDIPGVSVDTLWFGRRSKYVVLRVHNSAIHSIRNVLEKGRKGRNKSDESF